MIYVKRNGQLVSGFTSDTLDANYPVGYVYIQYYNTKTPAELGLPGTWNDITSTWNGRYMRANSSCFGCCYSSQSNVTASCPTSNTTTTGCGHTHTYPTCYCRQSGSTACGSSQPVNHCSTSCPVYCCPANMMSAHTHNVTWSNHTCVSTLMCPVSIGFRIWERVS